MLGKCDNMLGKNFCKETEIKQEREKVKKNSQEEGNIMLERRT